MEEGGKKGELNIACSGVRQQQPIKERRRKRNVRNFSNKQKQVNKQSP